MKKLTASLLFFMITFLSVTAGYTATGESIPQFSGMSDPRLQSYITSTMYDEILKDMDGEDYFIENIESVYISQEYLDEFAYNSQSNIFFGYSLAQLQEQFKGQKYVFTLGSNNETVVEPWTDYVDPYDKIIHNVTVGTGVILVCVTVSAVTAGLPACSMIFAVAAKTSAISALSGAALGGVSAGIIKGIQSGNINEAFDAAVTAGSEGFKWGAITGAVAGGVGEAIALKGATLNGLTMNEAAMIQRESKYPLDVIKGFKSMDQYEICREAGLKTHMIDGKTALVRNIDLDYMDEFGRTNLQRMQQGLAACDPTTGQAYQLHHIGQRMDSTLAILTEGEHMQGGNNLIWHEIKESVINRTVFAGQRETFWKEMSQILLMGEV